MNDTIPPLARKIVDRLESYDTQEYCSYQERIEEVAHLIDTHVPLWHYEQQALDLRDALIVIRNRTATTDPETSRMAQEALDRAA